MDNLSDMIRETAERLLAKHCGRAVLTEAAEGRWPVALWTALEEAGLTMAAVSEDGGGAGLPIGEALELVRIAGEHAAPVPLGETILASWLLDGCGLPVPPGPLAFAEVSAAGIAERVPWGRELAGLVAVRETIPGNPEMVLFDRTEWTVTPGANLAGEPRDTLTISAMAGADRAMAFPHGAGGLRLLGAGLRTLQIAGALHRVCRQSLTYAQDRVQFGRPLSKFQAVQQSLAVLGTQAAVVAAAAEIVKTAVGAGHLFPSLAIAKARAGEAAGLGGAIAHQVHGAMGFTREHDLQFSTKRLWAWRDEFGNEEHWNRLVGRHFLAAGPDRIWPEIAAD